MFVLNLKSQITTIQKLETDSGECLKYKTMFNELLEQNKYRQDYVSLLACSHILYDILTQKCK